MLAVPADLISEFQVADDGKVFAKSVRAIARLCGVDRRGLDRVFVEISSGDLAPSKLAKTIMATGFKGGDLIPDIIVAICIEHYSLDAGRYCTEVAKNNYRSFAAIGIRTALQSALGYVPRQYRRNPTTIYTEVTGLKSQVAEIKATVAAIKASVETLTLAIKPAPLEIPAAPVASVIPVIPFTLPSRLHLYRLPVVTASWKESGLFADRAAKRRPTVLMPT